MVATLAVPWNLHTRQGYVVQVKAIHGFGTRQSDGGGAAVAPVGASTVKGGPIQ